jgi:AmmeMemoRadiSam system protein A
VDFLMSPDATASTDSRPPLDAKAQGQLLRVAVQSIVHGLDHGKAMVVERSSSPPRLCEHQACFVTLYRGEELRGCVGTLEADEALIQQVADSAYNAAFRDTRLSSVDTSELRELTIEISVLSALGEIAAATERDLFGTLRPGVDGVVVTAGERHATFLPKVWDAFQLPFDFVEHLKRKAGLPPRYWSPALRWQRYTAESFGAPVGDLLEG